MRAWLRELKLLGVIGISAALSGLAHGAGVKAGPFEIEFRHERRMGSLPNGDPFKTHRIARYQVRHGGHVVAFNAGGVDPLKRKWLAGDLLEAHFVYSKGLPVVLVCTEGGTYVLSDRAGKPWVQQLSDRSATRYQFLDSVAGQPGELEALNAGPEEEAMGRDLDREGTLMSLHDHQNVNFGVLDLSTLTLQVSPVLKRHGFDAQDTEFGGYRYDPSAEGRPRAWWKDKRQLALVRDRYVGDVHSYALELVDLANDSFYMVPFDPNRMRLAALGDISSEWIAHYFEWRTDAAHPSSGARLAGRRDVVPRPWQGTTKADPYGAVMFRLQPVMPEMRDVLVRFLSDKFRATVDASAPKTSTIGLTIQQQLFTTSYSESTMSLTLTPPPGDPGALIARIAESFNRHIVQGRFQALFIAFGPAGIPR